MKNTSVSLQDFKRAKELFQLKDTVAINRLKKRYKKMIREIHPDIAGNNANTVNQTQALTEAYHCILTFCEEQEINISDTSFKRRHLFAWQKPGWMAGETANNDT